MFDLFRDTAKNYCEQEPINLNPAVHRRILNFLNEAISSADLEYAKPLFTTDCGLLSELASAPSDTAKN